VDNFYKNYPVCTLEQVISSNIKNVCICIKYSLQTTILQTNIFMKHPVDTEAQQHLHSSQHWLIIKRMVKTEWMVSQRFTTSGQEKDWAYSIVQLLRPAWSSPSAVTVLNMQSSSSSSSTSNSSIQGRKATRDAPRM